MTYTVERYLNRPDWMRARKGGLGASDAPVVLGFSRWRSAYGLAQEKLSKAIDDAAEDETAEWGHRHEAAICQKFCEVTGFVTSDPGDFTIYRSGERPYLFCTPDRFADDGVLEIKTAYYKPADEWFEHIPVAYMVQLQHTLYVTEKQRGWFAVLVDGHKFKYHPMRRHESWIRDVMLPRLDAFWAAIQRGEYPNVDGSEATARALAARYPNPTDSQVELEADYQELADEYDAILERGGKDDKRKLEIQNLVKERLGDFPVGILQDGSAFTWQQNGKGRRFNRSHKQWRPT
jgi:putative phage-type endonuclease